MFKSILWVFIFSSAILDGHTQAQDVSLSSAERKLLDSIGFDKDVFINVKAEINDKAERFYLPGKIKIVKGKQIETAKVYYNGLLFRVNKAKADPIITKLGKVLSQKGYMIFKSEGNMRNDPYRIGIIKTNDQFEILKIMGTSTSDSGHDNAWVINYTKNIYSRYPFRITGADMDWLEAEFITPPDNWTQFAQELFKDCPDIFDDEAENIDKVAQKMKTTGKLYLSWE